MCDYKKAWLLPWWLQFVQYEGPDSYVCETNIVKSI